MGKWKELAESMTMKCDRCGEVNPAEIHTCSPQREWQGLTDEELDQAMGYWSDPSRSAYGGAYRADGEYVDMKDTWRYIEAKLKEKNNDKR